MRVTHVGAVLTVIRRAEDRIEGVGRRRQMERRGGKGRGGERTRREERKQAD